MSKNASLQEVLVEQSVSGRSWIRRQSDARHVEQMCDEFGLDGLVAQILSARNVTPEHALAHLSPSLRESMPDPLILKDMDKAVERLATAIQEKETIGVFGDYDVDGTTASALLSRYFKSLQVKHEVYLPDRILEGYGPNLAAFLHLKEKGASVCMTVDCGAMAHEIIEQVQLEGVDVVVVDHHQMTLPAPPAVATVNPNRPDDISGLGNLSAAGVTFMVLAALSRQLRQAGFFETREEPKLIQWLDLVALGLVCDVMPLTGLTRVLVSQGLKVLGQFDTADATTAYPGLKVLARTAGKSGRAISDDLGFVIGPRINAAGRIGHANLAFNLMKEENYYESMALAEKLDQLNKRRQEIESNVLAEAVSQIESQNSSDNLSHAVVSSDAWHPGVIGIVAGRIKDKYHCPAIVISFEDDIGKGSARSVEGIDLGTIIADAKKNGLLLAGGGHAMAAGLTIERARLPEFQAYLEQSLADLHKVTGQAPAALIDASMSVAAISRDLVDQIGKAGPYGHGYPEPRVMLEKVRIRYADIKGGKHVACTLADDMGNTARAIAFRVADGPIGKALLKTDGSVHVIGKVKADEWRGGSAAQLIIEDVALAGE